MPIIGQRMLSEFRMTAPETSYEAVLAAFEDGCERATAVFESIDKVLVDRMSIIKKQVDEQEDYVIKQLNKVFRQPVKTLSLAESHFDLRLRHVKSFLEPSFSKSSEPSASFRKIQYAFASNIKRIHLLTYAESCVYRPLDPSLSCEVGMVFRFSLANSFIQQRVMDFSSRTERMWIFNSPYRVSIDVKSLKHVSSIKNPSDVSRKIVSPWGMASHPNGNIYFVEIINHRVFVVDANMHFVQTIDTMEDRITRIFKCPLCIAVSRSGIVAISDFSSEQIILFDETNKELKRIPELDEMPLFTQPVGIAFDWEENMYITDSQSPVIIKIRSAIKSTNIVQSSYVVEKFEVPPRFEQSGFSGVVVNQHDEVIAASVSASCVYVFSSGGRFIKSLPVPTYDKSHCMTLGPRDGFTISNQSKSKIYFFDRNGTVVHSIDMLCPVGVAFGSRNRFYALSQKTGTLEMYSV